MINVCVCFFSLPQYKMEAILEACLHSRKLQEEVALKDDLLAETELKIHSLGKWREEEHTDILEDEKKRR